MITPDLVDLSRYTAVLDRIDPICMAGEVVELVGLLVESRGPGRQPSEIFAKSAHARESPFAPRSSAFATAGYYQCHSKTLAA